MIARTSSNLPTHSARRSPGRPSFRCGALLLGATVALGLVAGPHRGPGLVPPGASDLDL
jgi:hypothetical protein